MLVETSAFDLLRDKSIFAILDGDTAFGDLKITRIQSDEWVDDVPNITIRLAMPYLSGPDICGLAKRFGLQITSTSQSRWKSMDELLTYCIKNHQESKMLSLLFSASQFVGLRDVCKEDFEKMHSAIVTRIIKEINRTLQFGGNELICIDSNYYIRKVGSLNTITAPSIKTVDRAYIVSISERAMQDVAMHNYDSAITKSRTLLEEVFCYVIERKDEVPYDKGDAGRLYNQVKCLYSMHQDAEHDKRINSLLRGLECILQAIVEMRNKDSDSHGVGNKRIGIDEHHARLFVNSATTMAEFIISVCEKACQ